MSICDTIITIPTAQREKDGLMQHSLVPRGLMKLQGRPDSEFQQTENPVQSISTVKNHHLGAYYEKPVLFTPSPVRPSCTGFWTSVLVPPVSLVHEWIMMEAFDAKNNTARSRHFGTRVRLFLMFKWVAPTASNYSWDSIHFFRQIVDGCQR